MWDDYPSGGRQSYENGMKMGSKQNNTQNSKCLIHNHYSPWKNSFISGWEEILFSLQQKTALPGISTKHSVSIYSKTRHIPYIKAGKAKPCRGKGFPKVCKRVRDTAPHPTHIGRIPARRPSYTTITYKQKRTKWSGEEVSGGGGSRRRRGRVNCSQNGILREE